MNYKKLENGQILIETEPNIWVHHDMEFHATLSATKQDILADGEDSTIITVDMLDYKGDVKHINDVEFLIEYDGEVVGTYIGPSLELATLSQGEHKVKTNIQGVRNGEVVINAK